MTKPQPSPLRCTTGSKNQLRELGMYPALIELLGAKLLEHELATLAQEIQQLIAIARKTAIQQNKCNGRSNNDSSGGLNLSSSKLQK